MITFLFSLLVTLFPLQPQPMTAEVVAVLDGGVVVSHDQQLITLRGTAAGPRVLLGCADPDQLLTCKLADQSPFFTPVIPE